MNWFKETFWLIKTPFQSKPENKIIMKRMDYYPFSGYKYMMWCGFCLYTKDKFEIMSEQDERHETIHVLQAKDLGSWIKYYWKYFVEWLSKNPIYDSKRAYRMNKFETEAYAKEDESDYINTRNPFNVDKFKIKDWKSWYKSNGGYNFYKSVKEYFKNI